MTSVFFQCPNIRCLEECIWHNELSKDRIPKLKDSALKMHSMFGDTHVCESIFSTMKQVNLKTEIEWKMKQWTIMSDFHL